WGRLGIVRLHFRVYGLSVIRSPPSSPYTTLFRSVYENLRAYYLEKNRYADSAATYRHFVRRFPLDSRAPDMQNKLIAAYTKGAFARDVLLAKQDYVTAYGIGSPYWQQADATQQNTLRLSLQPYLRELAAHYHAQAQQQTKRGQEQRDR